MVWWRASRGVGGLWASEYGCLVGGGFGIMVFIIDFIKLYVSFNKNNKNLLFCIIYWRVERILNNKKYVFSWQDITANFAAIPQKNLLSHMVAIIAGKKMQWF